MKIERKGMLFSLARILMEKKTFDSLQVQKLIYIIFGFYAAKYNRYLFTDKIEAWRYGPVIPVLYEEIKNGSKKICNSPSIEDKSILETLNRVVSIYGEKEGIWLMNRTYANNTPWSEVYDESLHKEIPKALIKSYYKKILGAQNFLHSYHTVFESLAKT